jgi:hypothetical protein
MMVYTLTFIEIKKLLEPIIMNFLKDQKKIREKMIAKAREIHKHIRKLKQANPEKYKKIDFIYKSPYSE